MEMARASTALVSVCSESIAYGPGANVLACDGSEDTPSIIDRDDPRVLGPASAESFDLPPALLSILSRNAPDGVIIYCRPEMCLEIFDPLERTHRTRRQAESVGAITDFPEKLAIITAKGYRSALTFNKNDAAHLAHLQLIDPVQAKSLCFKDGTLYFRGVNASSIDLTRYYDDTLEAIAGIDVAMLHCLYALRLHIIQPISKDPHALERLLSDPEYISCGMTIHLRGFLKMLGYKPNNSRDLERNVIERLRRFENVLGLLSDNDVDSSRQRAYPVIIFEEYNEETNTVSILRAGKIRRISHESHCQGTHLPPVRQGISRRTACMVLPGVPRGAQARDRCPVPGEAWGRPSAGQHRPLRCLRRGVYSRQSVTQEIRSRKKTL